MKRPFASACGGMASVEFALVLPMLMLVALAIYELTFRVQVVDELERYNFQIGDYLSRFDELTESDVDEVFSIADKIMPTAATGQYELSIMVLSIGYDVDGDPILLWKRTRGTKELPYDLETARGLATPGQSIIVAKSELSTDSLLSEVGSKRMTVATSSVFKPRVTRAIAIDGDLTDSVDQIEGYDDA